MSSAAVPTWNQQVLYGDVLEALPALKNGQRNALTVSELKRRQLLPLTDKVSLTLEKIKLWYELFDGNVYVAFSGGKDSTVLLDLVRSLYPEVPAVFVDTGLEYPEIRDFVKTFDNVIWIKPSMPFPRVIRKYGYPVISKEISMAISRFRNAKEAFPDFDEWGSLVPPTKAKEYRLMGGKKGERKGTISKKWKFLINAPFKISDECCGIMKKGPVKKVKGFAYIGIMAQDSKLREQYYIRNGCNAINLKHPHSWPMSFWVEQDIWDYIELTGIPYSKIYDLGYDRTGCMWCMFGVHMEKGKNRFQRMAITHPRQYEYCMEKLGLRKILSFMGIPYRPYDQQTLEVEV